MTILLRILTSSAYGSVTLRKFDDVSCLSCSGGQFGGADGQPQGAIDAAALGPGGVVKSAKEKNRSANLWHAYAFLRKLATS